MKKLSLFTSLLMLLFSLPSYALASTPMVTAGDGYTVALKTDGTVWAWGDNDYGQLGDGTTTSSSTPVQVSDLTGVQAIAAGSHYTVALKEDGTVWAWGSNWYGQLGNGTTTHSSIPLQASGLTGVQAIAAGLFHTVALKEDGTVWAWGCNLSGELGMRNTPNSSIPVQVSEITGVQAVAAGGTYALALKKNGTVLEWGAGSTTPALVGDLTGVQAIAVGSRRTVVALKEDGKVWIWTWQQNLQGQPPVLVSDLTGVQAIAAGANHNVALKEDGTVWTWGQNDFGQLGNGTTTANYSTPTQVTGMEGVQAIAAGASHTVALNDVGVVYAWGDNSSGQLGERNTTTSSSIPVYSFNMVKVEAIAAGHEHAVFLKEDGTVWTWGQNNYGQLGDGVVRNGDEITSPSIHLIFRPFLIALQSRNPQRSQLRLWFPSIRSIKTDLNLSAYMGKLFRPRPLLIFPFGTILQLQGKQHPYRSEV